MNYMEKLTIKVILGSTRQGRFSEKPGIDSRRTAEAQ